MRKVVPKIFESSFIVFPEHTNHMTPLIFGGKFMSELDLCAAKCVRRFLYHSEVAHSSVTHKASIEFLKPCYTGDFIIMRSEVIKTGKKSIVVSTIAHREAKGKDPEVIAKAEFVFITIDNVDSFSNKPKYLPYIEHELEI